MENPRITLRIAAEAIAIIDRYAAASGVNQSDFIRQAIEAHIKSMGGVLDASVPKAGTYQRKSKAKTSA